MLTRKCNILFVLIAFGFTAYGQSLLVGQEVTREQFDLKMQQWKENYKELVREYYQFKLSGEQDAAEIQQRWRTLKSEGDKLVGEVIDIGAELYQSSTIPDADIRQLLDNMTLRYFNGARYEKSARIGVSLLKHDPDNHAILFDAIKSAFFSNNFDLAEQLFDHWKQTHGELPEKLMPIYNFLEDYKKEWQRELEVQKQEALDDDLPRIQINTELGQIVIELFENQAPNAVNNLVHLIETEFYKEKTMNFFEVFMHQYALTGCPYNNGTGGPNVGVKSESKNKEARKHFRGVISMRVNPNDDSVRSQFYLVRIPTPEFDGVNLVVGRVIEGMNIVDQLKPTHQYGQKFAVQLIEDAVADRLFSVKVLRKRDHDYRPEILKK